MEVYQYTQTFSWGPQELAFLPVFEQLSIWTLQARKFSWVDIQVKWNLNSHNHLQIVGNWKIIV
jgi:hypothetical protein